MKILETIGRVVGYELEKIKEQTIKDQIKAILETEKIDMNIEDPEQQKMIMDLLNGKYDFISVEVGESETHLIVLESGTDRFVIGHIINVDFNPIGVGIKVGEMKPNIDPLEFGKKVRAGIEDPEPCDCENCRAKRENTTIH